MPEKLPTPDKTEEGTRDKRKAIVIAAREIFARQGYEATTIAEIANAAEVAVGTVYLYFPNKREVYVAASLSLFDEIADVLLQPEILASPLKQVPRALIESTFRTCRANSKFMPLFQVNLQTPAEIEMHHKDHSRIVQAINLLLLHYVAQGDMAPFDTEMYAKILFHLVNSVLYDCFSLESGANEERYRELTIEVVERIFFGPALHP
jgi:AcrR family transcriptional regulator